MMLMSCKTWEPVFMAMALFCLWYVGTPVLCYAINSGALEAVTILIKAGAHADRYATKRDEAWNIYGKGYVCNILKYIKQSKRYASSVL